MSRREWFAKKKLCMKKKGMKRYCEDVVAGMKGNKKFLGYAALQRSNETRMCERDKRNGDCRPRER
jgi:hypothetical protein